MRLRPEPREAGVSAIPAFLALGAVAAVVVLAVTIAAFWGPADAPPGDPLAVNEAGPTVPANATDPVNATVPADVPAAAGPTSTPRPLRIVSGADAGPATGAGSSVAVWPDGGKAARHIAYAFQPDVNGIAEFTACWIVPPRPRYEGKQKHTIFLWAGIQQGSSGLIQAVLEWDHDETGKYWTLACWAVDRKEQTYNVSRRIAAYPGDRVRAVLSYGADAENPGRKVWHVVLTDETHDCSTELIDRGRAVDGNSGVTIFGGVLEGIGYVLHPIDLPGDVTFDDIACRDEGGAAMPMCLTGYVDPVFPGVAVEYDDGPQGTPVIIRTGHPAY